LQEQRDSVPLLSSRILKRLPNGGLDLDHAHSNWNAVREVWGLVNAEQHRFAVDHERAVAVTQRGFWYQRIVAAEIMTVAREQLHSLHDQPAVVSHGSTPAGRNRGRTGGNTEFEYIFKHDD
jgi:hypothetical protein